MSASSHSEKDKLEDEKVHHATVATKEVDSGAALSYQFQGEIDPAEAIRIRYVIPAHVVTNTY